MRPRAWARRGRKSDPQELRIDRNDERVCVRIVPQSHLYAGCFGWGSFCAPSTRGTPPTQVPVCPASRSTQLNPGHRRRCPYQRRSLRRCCDEASISAKLGWPWSITSRAATWVGVDPPGVSDGKGQCADGGRTGDAAPIRKGHLVLVSEYGPSQRPAGG